MDCCASPLRFCLCDAKIGLRLAVIAAINIVYGAFCSMAQTDIKRMIAYSSVNHMGMRSWDGVFKCESISGAALQMINHGVITELCSSWWADL